jgi:hypothetical protein
VAQNAKLRVSTGSSRSEGHIMITPNGTTNVVRDSRIEVFTIPVKEEPERATSYENVASVEEEALLSALR